ncbi:MAG TPA: DoxX family protein [Kofleriaceae bacterium]|nr:DoxX family protein [Kofleriaceae bacterium]
MTSRAPRRLAASARRLEEPLYAALRVIAGLNLATHGAQKLFGWFAKAPADDRQIWVGGVIELVTGLLIGIGLYTRPAAFLAAGTMAVAYFQYHFKFDFAAWHWAPVVNKGELAVIYCFVFLFFVARGDGPYSVTARLGGRGG